MGNKFSFGEKVFFVELIPNGYPMIAQGYVCGIEGELDRERVGVCEPFVYNLFSPNGCIYFKRNESALYSSKEQLIKFLKGALKEQI